MNSDCSALADILVQLNRLDDAAKVYWQLLERNPENVAYYKRLEECKSLGIVLFSICDFFLPQFQSWATGQI